MVTATVHFSVVNQCAVAGLHPSEAAWSRPDIVLTGETKARVTWLASFAGSEAFNTLIFAQCDTGTVVLSDALLMIRDIIAIAVSRRASESGLVQSGTVPSPARGACGDRQTEGNR
jgi:hypothetical protein